MSNASISKPNWEEINDKIVITLPDDFDFAANLSYLERNKNECMFIVKNKTVTRVIATKSNHVLVQLSVNDDKEMIIHFLHGTRPEAQSERGEIVTYVRDWFDLDYDIVPFYTMAKMDPILKGPVAQFRGLRLCGVPDLFEALCWGVLGQQINLPFAYTLKRQFVEKFGTYIIADNQKHWIFPTYDDIAKLTVEDLADIKMTVRKSEYIIGIAQLMTTGALSKDALMNEASLRDVEKSLTSIRGIGPWTANYILMRCLRFPTAFPIADVGLHNAIKHITNSDRKPTKEELIALSATWDQFQAYATFYLWRVLY